MEFRLLENMDQLEIFRGCKGRVANNMDLSTFEINCNKDSTDTPVGDTPIKGYTIMCTSGMKWMGSIIECWIVGIRKQPD